MNTINGHLPLFAAAAQGTAQDGKGGAFARLIHAVIYMPGWLQVLIVMGGAALILVLWASDRRSRLDPDTGREDAGNAPHIVRMLLIAVLVFLVTVTLLGVFGGTYLLTVGQTL